MEKLKIFDTEQYLQKVDAWWRAANYISVGQMYLRDNPLLRKPISKNDVKIYPIGHWGTIPGQNFIYAHLNRIINKYNLNMFYIEGPGHGGQVMISNSYLDGSYSELFPHITRDEKGLKHLFKYFSFPGGTASHAAPETPGSIHEGGELGYSISHATGAILDNPNVIAATIIGDGEAETGPLAASWFSNSFINPVTDGAVLPIINVNGGKISNPTILGRKTDKELRSYFLGMGWKPYILHLKRPNLESHKKMALVMDKVIEEIQTIQSLARKKDAAEAKKPNWPVIILFSPKGWTGPKKWNGEQIEGSFRAHQVPIPVSADDMKHVDKLVEWLKSYKPEELFDENYQFKKEFDISPKNNQRMAMNPITNGGINPKKLVLPNWKKFALKIDKPGLTVAQDMVELGNYLAQVVLDNPNNFRIFGPDENKSNRLYNLFKVTNRQWMEKIDKKYDEFLSPSGRIIDSQLSEHQAEGFLEGYVLTGRHGIFASYESFFRVVDSMITQHMKWLKKATDISWRNDYPSLNLIASSNAFQQDHNGYTHQDPGLLNHLADKKPELIREYLPADTNTLLATINKSLTERNLINLIVASKQPRIQLFNINEAEEIVQKGYKTIDWASNTLKNDEPDLVVAAAGTEPNIEALATISIINKEFPKLKIRFVTVSDILKLRHLSIDPRGLSDQEFDQVFTKNKPILFAFHGYESLLRDIFFLRNNKNLITHGYRENGDITTSFDIRVLSKMDRFHMAIDVAKKLFSSEAKDFINKMIQKLEEHNKYIREYGTDLPEIKEWKWEGIK